MRVQLEILLGTLLFIITTGILIFIGFNEEKRMGEFEQHQEAQSIEVGAALFEINCRGCHGLRGEGIPNLAPPMNDTHFFTQRLSEVGWQGDLEDYIIATISSGRQVSTRPDLYPGAGNPAMPTWSENYGGPLREDQIESLADFILNWEATAVGGAQLTLVPTPTPSSEFSDDPVLRGQTVFEANGCGACHTIDGISIGNVGPVLNSMGETGVTRVDNSSAEEYLRQSILDPSAFLVEGYDDLMVKTYGDTLSNPQIDDLVTFLMAK
jgi:mono/diheme cytochrome c family protein